MKFIAEEVALPNQSDSCIPVKAPRELLRAFTTGLNPLSVPLRSEKLLASALTRLPSSAMVCRRLRWDTVDYLRVVSLLDSSFFSSCIAEVSALILEDTFPNRLPRLL